MLLITAPDEPAHHLYPDGKRIEPLPESLHVLLRKDRRRAEKRHLLSGHHRKKCRSEGHLRLSVPHVSAHQPVHGPGADHVLDDFGDRPFLILRLLKIEAGGKLLECGIGLVEGKALGERSLGMYGEKFGRHLLHFLPDPSLYLLPSPRPEPIGLHRTRLPSHILLNQVQAVRW